MTSELPTPSRSVDVARAYVEGLERDRTELRSLEERYDRLVWEMIQIAAYAKVLYVALHQIAQGSGNWDRIDELLAADRRVYSEVWACECGHHRYDHDEDGRCSFLTCRRICGSN